MFLELFKILDSHSDSFVRLPQRECGLNQGRASLRRWRSKQTFRAAAGSLVTVLVSPDCSLVMGDQRMCVAVHVNTSNYLPPGDRR